MKRFDTELLRSLQASGDRTTRIQLRHCLSERFGHRVMIGRVDDAIGRMESAGYVQTFWLARAPHNVKYGTTYVQLTDLGRRVLVLPMSESSAKTPWIVYAVVSVMIWAAAIYAIRGVHP